MSALLVIVFAASAVVLVRAAVVLAGTADEMAEITGLGRVLIGTIVLAGATSLPEVLTDVTAVVADAPDLAVGDLFGSSMANMAILAVVDLVHRGRVWPAVEVAHARVAAVAMALTSFAAVATLTPEGPSIGWVGLDTLAIFLGYVGTAVWFRRYPVVVRVGGLLPVTPPPEPQEPLNSRPLRVVLRSFGLAVVAILVAAPVLAISARELAETAGISEGVVGAALLAVVTSLPELTTSLAAVRIGAHDLAVGNLFGSNAANMAVLFIADAAYLDGPILNAVRPEQAVPALGAILMMAMALAAIVTGRDERVGRLEPDAILLACMEVPGFEADTSPRSDQQLSVMAVQMNERRVIGVEDRQLVVSDDRSRLPGIAGEHPRSMEKLHGSAGGTRDLMKPEVVQWLTGFVWIEVREHHTQGGQHLLSRREHLYAVDRAERMENDVARHGIDVASLDRSTHPSGLDERCPTTHERVIHRQASEMVLGTGKGSPVLIDLVGMAHRCEQDRSHERRRTSRPPPVRRVGRVSRPSVSRE